MWANLKNLSFSCGHWWGWTAGGVRADKPPGSHWTTRTGHADGAQWERTYADGLWILRGLVRCGGATFRCRRLFWVELGDGRLHTVAISLRTSWRFGTRECCLRCWSHFLSPLHGWYLQFCPSQPKTSYIWESFSNQKTNCARDICFPAPTNGLATGVIRQTGSVTIMRCTYLQLWYHKELNSESYRFWSDI